MNTQAIVLTVLGLSFFGIDELLGITGLSAEVWLVCVPAQVVCMCLACTRQYGLFMTAASTC